MSSIYDYKQDISQDDEMKAAKMFQYDHCYQFQWPIIRKYMVGGIEAMKWLTENVPNDWGVEKLQEYLVQLCIQFPNVPNLDWALKNNLNHDSTIFMSAFRYADLKMAKYLVNTGLVTDKNDCTYTFLVAGENGNLEVLKYLKNEGFAFGGNISSYYQDSWDNGYFEVFQYLYQQRLLEDNDSVIYLYHTEQERMNMDRHWYKVSVLYDCLINRKDIMNVAEYVESDIDTLFEDYDDNEDNEEESDIDLLSYSSDSYDETDDMEISTREFVPVTLEF
jgi:hypothetical protein